MLSTRKSIQVITWLIGTIIVIVTTMPAVSYFIVEYNQMQGKLQTELFINADSLNRIISLNPELWEYDEERIRGVLRHGHGEDTNELWRVLNMKDEVVVESGVWPEGPRMKQEADLLDFGEAAGSLEVHRSLRPVVVRSTWILGVMWIAGGVIFLIMQRVVGRVFLRAERRLRVSERKYWSLYNDALDMIHIIDTKGNIVEANLMELATLGYSRSELLGKSLVDIVHPAYRHQSRMALGSLLRGEKIKSYKTAFITRDGGKIDVEVNAVPQIRDGKVTSVRAIIRDITQSEQSQADLLRYQNRLHALASVVASAEERERRELASVLHDDIGQLLAMCKLNLEQIPSGNEGGGRVRDAASARRLLSQAIARTRSLTWELSSQTLYALGLTPALEELCSALEERHDLKCRVVSGKGVDRIPEDILGTVYRATRELLYNVLRHAEAKSAEVLIAAEKKGLRITVSDDGKGFQHSSTDFSPASDGGFGLFNIGERLDDIGGRLDIDSAPGKGAKVTIMVPLNKDGKG